MSEIRADEFLRVFRTRKEFCRALLELSRQQSARIEADDYEQLLELLTQKQRLLARMDEEGRRDASIWSNWRSQRERLDAGDRDRCEQALADIESLLGQLVAYEHESSSLLEGRRRQTRAQLQSVTQGGQAHEAYRDAVPATHRHLNLDR